MNIFSLAMRMLGRIKYAPKFEKETKDPIGTQEELLLDIINKNEDTVYGKKHKFNEIENVSDFKKNVPLNNYSDLLPYIEKMKKGKKNILTAEPTLLFALTSGTTGEPKYISLTESYIEGYQKTTQTWFYYLVKDHPGYFNGKLFIPPSTFEGKDTEGGIPVDTISGHILKKLPSMIRKKYILSAEDLRGCKDYEAKYYLMMRLSIEEDVSAIAMANPATLLLLCRKGDEYRKEIVDDIRHGKVNSSFNINNKTRENINKRLEPNPERAEELERIIADKGRLLPKFYWKNLSSIGLWKGGPLAAYLPQMSEYFNNVPIRDSGYSATEGRFCTPVDDENSDGVLAVNNIFFEFVSEEDGGSDNPKTLLADELELDKNYYVIITTLSGLYRYRMNDVVRVTGWYNKTPKISFQHKGEGVSSIVGEKISEWQVLSALDDTRKRTELPLNFALVKAETEEKPFYKFYASFKRALEEGEKEIFLRSIDESLQAYNMEYKKRRESQRLEFPRLEEIDGDKFNYKYHNYRLKNGAYEVQIKTPCLITNYNEKDFNNMKKEGII